MLSTFTAMTQEKQPVAGTTTNSQAEKINFIGANVKKSQRDFGVD
jgi:hypothetical protein